ncbi:MAG: hypothetical protein DRJ51_04460 [Thermoprotei archaeon]|nr:MAG: hypothetical protein DRJ51_04460 [Thermoprotei archaeon]
MKVIIDTDIGDDIDDALALALALNSPEIEVLAITTVYGRVNLRAKLAAKLLKACNRSDIPIAAGCSKPILEPEPTHFPNQAVALTEGEEYPNIVKEHAVNLIVNILEREKAVTIITLGPLTNIALALLLRKDVFKDKRLVIMGGCLTKPIAEYNVKCDPEAASIVLNSGLPITVVGLDVTLKCIMTTKMLLSLESSTRPYADVLREYLRLWREHTNRQNPILHDPLAVAVVTRPELVKRRRLCVDVELHGRHTRGLTVIKKNAAPNVEACYDVAVEDFLRLYESRVLA